MSTTNSVARTLSFWVALALLPLAVAAQDNGSIASSDDEQRLSQAEELYSQASTLAQTRCQWARAARLYKESAALRPVGDPLVFESRMSAARILHHLGKTNDAMRTLIKAGDQAHEAGQVMNAAQAYLDVAWMAKKDGQGAQALEFAERGRLLASSPHITLADRTSILSRVGADSPTVRVIRN